MTGGTYAFALNRGQLVRTQNVERKTSELDDANACPLSCNCQFVNYYSTSHHPTAIFVHKLFTLPHHHPQYLLIRCRSNLILDQTSGVILIRPPSLNEKFASYLITSGCGTCPTTHLLSRRRCERFSTPPSVSDSCNGFKHFDSDLSVPGKSNYISILLAKLPRLSRSIHHFSIVCNQ